MFKRKVYESLIEWKMIIALKLKYTKKEVKALLIIEKPLFE